MMLNATLDIPHRNRSCAAQGLILFLMEIAGLDTEWTEGGLCQELAGAQGKVGQRQRVAPPEITYSYLWFNSLQVENHHFPCYYI